VGVRSNYSHEWETAQQPMTVTQQQIIRYFEMNNELVVTKAASSFTIA